MVIDDVGIYFDGRSPSRLELLLQEGMEHDPQEVRRLLSVLKDQGLSKYTPPVARSSAGEPCILVVDQTAGDASITGAEADAGSFRRMLAAARSEHPGKRIVVKAHPEVVSGRKRGHFSPGMLGDNVEFLTEPINTWDLLARAEAVYTVSSQLGYEAILAGRPVRCFGKAFYAGWGLTEDEQRIDRRTRALTVEELFAGCHLSYPIYYDPWRDRLCDFETACKVLACQVEAQTDNDDRMGDVFVEVRLWKRGNLRQFRPGPIRPRYETEAASAITKAQADGRRIWFWGSKFPTGLVSEQPDTGMVEDGFLRSVGLGAELTQAASLVFDRRGIYFDPNHPSDLEQHIQHAAEGGADLQRARTLRDAIVRGGVTKYNLQTGWVPACPEGRRVILVPGQVEDDASILRGCGEIRTNLDLLRAARAENPDAYLIYKPHPDVAVGLRAGAVAHADLQGLADVVAEDASATELLDLCDDLWTLTSLMGFEALLRGKDVTCLGTPFYAGWGLTRDFGPACPRRTARPNLDQLVWAALIAYPSYVDPVSGLPCSPELVVERLETGKPGRKAGLLSKLQGLLAAQSWLWRN